MKIFNANGEAAYQEWIQQFCKDPKNTTFRDELLHDSFFCTDVGNKPDPTVSGAFKTKYDMMEFLMPFINDAIAFVHEGMSEQRRLWDSCAYRMLESICRKDETGAWKPGHPAKYMIWDLGDSIMPLYQRHLIYTPFRFMRTNADAMRPFFEAVDPATGTGFEEEIGARQEFIENPNVLALFNRLYVNREGKQIKGFFAMAKKVKGTNVKYCKPGSIRRLMAVLMQMKNTYDILQCTPEKMMELLPEEFTKWEQEHK